ncbi:MAG: NAD(P)/FAD-dependent oxidoreductase [Clostridia bacterium]|nr:NAD(P)/FAD-dependent oxidoreductase [Clostridia bacterium]
MKYDVCIIGGGAAGLAAAASFHKDTRVCVLEKNDIAGRKVLATGGGRCNLTNAACENHEMVLEFFRNLGLETHCDEEGRYYPYSNRAADVVEILMSAIGENVTFRYGFDVRVVSRVKGGPDEINGFMITGSCGEGDSEMIFADRVIIAMGGKAGPQFGTTGDGYTIARTLGHVVTRVFPVLSGLECEADGVDFAALKGIRARGRLVLHRLDEALAEETGEIQFTEDGISGICVFNLTPYIKANPGEKPADAMKKYRVEVDLAPDYSEEDLAGREHSFGIVTGALAEILEPQQLKSWTLQVTGVKGWKDAQATSGGVDLEEINMDTMESRIVKGLYFAGEILNVQGPCGGFNLQNAWETGIKAAKAINAEMESE